MLRTQDLISCRELIQDDLLTRLDGLDDSILTDVCQIIVDRMALLVALLEENLD